MSPALNMEVISLRDVPIDRLTPAAPKQQPAVLVVDDERVIADTLSIILGRNGFTVQTAYDGESALEKARAVTPQLLLSDVMLGPGIDGIQLAIAMVQACPGCKVLLFSGHAATADLLAKAREAGHDFALMTKPVHPADLLARINESFAASNGAQKTLLAHA
jgi:DNA-binding response OmpR family regulator